MAPAFRFVIVGGGLAARRAAAALREYGYDGPLLIIGSEGERPYIRTPLSKGCLLGKEDRDSIFVHPADWYPEHDVELLLGTTVTSVKRRLSQPD
ncbi:FAD-dependent oxidoreductase [Streptomyces umbrinus]|uniref:FAD-dependent oxidoreductase n=1 Tax=Streptomyces umbrinus TaxID=67370 RepID=UPI003DD2109E